MRTMAPVAAALLLLSGCGGDDAAPLPKSTPSPTPTSKASPMQAPAGPAVPSEPGLMVDPAGAKWRYQEKAESVTQSMQQQAGETDAYFEQK